MIAQPPARSSDQLAQFVAAIAAKRAEMLADRALLVGISGIDASGKGFIAAKIAKRLEMSGWRVAKINVDNWLNPFEVCISRPTPGEHFYKHAMRFDEMFDQLIVPLQENRAVSFVADCADAKGNRRKHSYEFSKIDIVLLEGIFLFKSAYRHHFDITAWVKCSFSTALKRAIVRCQEGLPPAETIRDFTTIYFPAQEIHFARDNPQAVADFTIQNDKAP